MLSITRLLGGLVLIATSSSAVAQMVEDSDGPEPVVGSIIYEGPALYWPPDGTPRREFCPIECYTEVIQKTVIRCQAELGLADDLATVDDRGELVGQVPRWTTTEHHTLVERSVFQDLNCNRHVHDTQVQDLGNMPAYFPGDPNILDIRTSKELGLNPFDCNDHYPVEIDLTGPEPIMTTKLEFELLIDRSSSCF